MSDVFEGLPRNHYGAILADPPWQFKTLWGTATRGSPKRLNADVRQGIIAPRRQHSRKPDGVHERIERLVAGPYLELFARQKRPGWDVWGDQTDKFRAIKPEAAK